MSDPAVQTAKKRNKRKKKKNASDKAEGGCEGGEDKMPKQATDQAEGVVTTTKCQRCKRQFTQFVTPGETTADLAQRMCKQCMLTTEEEKAANGDVGGVRTLTLKEAPGSGCNCAACVVKREHNMLPAEVGCDAQITQDYWMEIRHIVRRIYRENMPLENNSTRNSIGSDKMRMIVRKLCTRDPHLFFQRLETLAREYLLEVKVRLLEQLSCGFNSPQLAIEFIQMLIDEYSTLTNSLPPLLYLLEPLEETEYVQCLGVTVELMNKNIFRELIFAESFMSSNLPLIIAQLRLASLASDPYHRNTADALSQRYVALDKEMEEISCVWKSAKDRLNHHHHHNSHRQHEIKADGNEFMKMKNASLHAAHLKNKSNAPIPGPVPIIEGLSHPATGQKAEHTAQLNEWSKLLFKCIRPIGEPEFRRNGDIATHTITLRLDMTELDLHHAQPTCCKNDLRKYRRLGMSVDEIVEVAMKLNALKSLGFNLKIEDLFDEEGFSLSEVNQALRKPQQGGVGGGGGGGGGGGSATDDVYFIDSGEESDGEDKREQLTPQEKGDMLRAKERILKRMESGNPQSRLSDFLQGMTMKIRFMKKLSGEDDQNFTPNNGGKVMFSSCDQVQMKLTQLELNSVRLVTSAECVGSDLGLEKGPVPRMTASCGNGSRDDYAFIHTDSHREFMDLLLEKRCHLDATVTKKEKERQQSGSDPPSNRQSFKVGKGQEVTNEKREPSPVTNGVGQPPLVQPTGPAGFTPLYLPTSSQPCQCSACVGAMAASITKENTRPLNPTDPSRSDVTIQSSLDKHLSRPERSKKPSSPVSKEMMWKDWMAASGSSQLMESEGHIITNSPSHHHSYHCHHHHGDGMDGDSGYGDSLKSACSMSCDCHTHHSSHDQHNGCSSPSYCANGGNVSSLSGATGTENSRRYCPCCYCELFGNNGPPTIPTSHNFTKQRDKMRHKLEEKRREKELGRHYNIPHQNSSDTDSRPLDELLAYIQGPEEEVGVAVGVAVGGVKTTKKKKKAKKVHQPSLPATEEESSDHSSQSHDTATLTNQDMAQRAIKSHGSRGHTDHTHNSTHRDVSKSLRAGGKDKGYSQKPHPLSIGKTSESEHQPSEELSDDYDDELEAFKKICFAAPVVTRKRIAVSLDMSDLVAKMK